MTLCDFPCLHVLPRGKHMGGGYWKYLARDNQLALHEIFMNHIALTSIVLP